MAGTDLEVLFDLLSEAEGPGGLDTNKPGAKALIDATLVDANGRITITGRELLKRLQEVFRMLGAAWQGLALGGDAPSATVDQTGVGTTASKPPGADGKF